MTEVLGRGYTQTGHEVELQERVSNNGAYNRIEYRIYYVNKPDWSSTWDQSRTYNEQSFKSITTVQAPSVPGRY